MKKIYSYYTVGDILKNVFELVFAVAIGAAFAYYKIYAALVFLIVIIAVLIYLDIRFIIMDDKKLSDFKRTAVSESIDYEQIGEVTTAVKDKKVFVCVYGAGKAITFPYRPKAYVALLKHMNLQDDVISGILDSVVYDSPVRVDDFVIRKNTVLIDELFGKREFVRREIVRDGK
ncbi:MAG: hypothetical protein K6F92_05765 [Lachnospiraceae bacterium]|nr:hypothetical protein [Lachnospiraceae bacterium]